jgi:hypothetical protein
MKNVQSIKEHYQDLAVLCIASCSCCTKTDDYTFHKESCRYHIYRKEMKEIEDRCLI